MAVARGHEGSHHNTSALSISCGVGKWGPCIVPVELNPAGTMLEFCVSLVNLIGADFGYFDEWLLTACAFSVAMVAWRPVCCASASGTFFLSTVFTLVAVVALGASSCMPRAS